MSKADRLGNGASFGAAGTARSSRRSLIDNTINGGDNGTAAITDLPVTLISDNPDNPRNHLRNLEETVESVREVGIILPIVVATTDAYLRDRPDRAADLDDGSHYIVVDGHRRLEAARRVGLATIPVRVDDARVSTDESLLEAAFIANYHRDDMTDLEEAHALQQLVEYYDSQTKAGKRLGIPQATLSSKLSLLKLTPELQKDLATGTRSVEHVRNLGKLTPAEQKAKADERAAAAEETKKGRRTAKGAGPATPANYHGVIIADTSPGAAGEGQAPREQSQPGNPAAPSPATEPIPEPRAAPSTQAANNPGERPDLPYEQPDALATLLDTKLDDDTFFGLLRFLNEKARKRNPTRYAELARSLTEPVTAPTN